MPPPVPEIVIPVFRSSPGKSVSVYPTCPVDDKKSNATSTLSDTALRLRAMFHGCPEALENAPSRFRHIFRSSGLPPAVPLTLFHPPPPNRIVTPARRTVPAAAFGFAASPFSHTLLSPPSHTGVSRRGAK